MFPHHLLCARPRARGRGRRNQGAAVAAALLVFVLGACDDGGELAEYDPGQEASSTTTPGEAEPASPFMVDPQETLDDGAGPVEPGTLDPSDAGDDPVAPAPDPVAPGSEEAPAGSGGTVRADPLPGGSGVDGGVDTTS